MKVGSSWSKRICVSSLVVFCSLSGFFQPRALAANFPDRPISLVVPFAAGGPVDVIARAVADSLAKELNGTVVVDNKAGAGGGIAFSYVARSKPDGYTLVAVDMSFAVLPHFHRDAGYDPDKDFRMIGQTTRSTLVLVVPADSKTPDLESFIQNARRAGEGVSIANAGIGSTPHLAALSFAKVAKIKPLMVPYRGMTPAVTDLLAGRITSAFVGPQSAIGLVKEGKLKMLAAIGQKRLKEAPGVPTFSEKGMNLPGFQARHLVWPCRAGWHAHAHYRKAQRRAQSRARQAGLAEAARTPGHLRSKDDAFGVRRLCPRSSGAVE